MAEYSLRSDRDQTVIEASPNRQHAAQLFQKMLYMIGSFSTIADFLVLTLTKRLSI